VVFTEKDKVEINFCAKTIIMVQRISFEATVTEWTEKTFDCAAQKLKF